MTDEDHCWEISEGKVDSTRFVDLLIDTLPEATTFYIEISVYLPGNKIDSDVENLFEKFRQEGLYLPDSQTIWPKSKSRYYRCEFSEAFLKELSELTQNHAEPELFDHMFIYQNETCLLKWPDAFSNCMWISKEIPEGRVKKFADKLGLPYKKVYD